MWAHLEIELVQDGEIPELATGAVLRHVGLRAVCGALRESYDDEGRIVPMGSDL